MMVIYLLISLIIAAGFILFSVYIIPNIISEKLVSSQSEPAFCVSANLKIFTVNKTFISTFNPGVPESEIIRSDKIKGLLKVIDESISSGRLDSFHWSYSNKTESMKFYVHIQPVSLAFRERYYLVKLVKELTKFEDIYFEVIHKLIHDLKSPLSTALISLQNLKLSYDDNIRSVNSSYDDIEDYVQPALEAISDIKKFANILSMISNTSINNYSSCDFADFSNRVFSQISDEITNSVTFTWEIKTKLPPVMINKQEMELALKNIVKNRLNALDSTGNINIIVSPKSSIGTQKIRILIADTTKENLSRIVTPEMADKNIGYYKDLLIAMRIIEKHGSLLLIEKNEDKGNRLSFELNTETENGKL